LCMGSWNDVATTPGVSGSSPGRQDGEVRSISRTVTGTKRQAQVALAKLVTNIEAGQATRSHQTSVAEQLDRWLAEIEPTRVAYTVKEHRRCIEHDIKPALGSVRLDKLTPRQLDAFYADLLARGCHRHRCSVSIRCFTPH
jgi:hypothetical protein